MRHNKAGRHFGRTANQRKALLRGILGSLLLHERIETTLARAKEIRPIAERMITLGIRGDLAARRTALSNLPDKEIVSRLFAVIAPRFKGSNGGYLRIVQTRNRVNDRSPMAVIEFTDYEEVTGKVKREEAAKKREPKKEKEGEEK